MRRPRARLAGTTLALLALLAAGSARGDVEGARPPDFADGVGHAYAPAIPDLFEWKIECEAPLGVDDWVVAYAVEGAAPGIFVQQFFSQGRSSAEGTVVQAGDVRHVVDARVESGRPGEVKRFRIWQLALVPGDGPFAFRVAWATWGGTATCSVEVEQVALEPSLHAGEHALYAGPESFTLGAFAQHGATEVSAGHVFHRTTAGGPLFASVYSWEPNVPYVPTAEVWVQDDRYTGGASTTCALTPCMVSAPSASSIAAVIPVGLSLEGAPQSQVWLMGLPPQA